MQRIETLFLLKIDARQPIDSFVPHDGRNVPFDDCFDGTACTAVHSIRQFKVADRKFGLIYMEMQSVQARIIHAMILLQLGIQPGNGIEVLTLVRVKQHLTEVRIFEFGMARFDRGN